jgi:U4/U6.U5 tri-snRNP-associated protein 1
VEDINEAGGESGLTFDDTSEFVRAISYNPAPVKIEQVESSIAPSPTKTRSPSRDVSIAADEALDEIEAGEVVMKEEDDEEMLEAIEQVIRDTEAAERIAAENGGPEVGTSTEPTFGSGMSGTLALLRQQGLLAQPTDDQQERERVQRQRDLWLADHRRLHAQRELEKLQGRGGNKDQATREYENRVREQQEARANLEMYKNYKPDITIVYYDEFGRSLTPKEAWKALSHKFHGKGSGKMKTEKRLKKIAEEKKKEAMASGDTPLSMNKAFQIRQEKTGQAHFVLSVGNRGYVLFVLRSWRTNVSLLPALCLKRQSSWILSHCRRARQRKRRARRRRLPNLVVLRSSTRQVSSPCLLRRQMAQSAPAPPLLAFYHSHQRTVLGLQHPR